jgi:hypothetical protein
MNSHEYALRGNDLLFLGALHDTISIRGYMTLKKTRLDDISTQWLAVRIEG